MKNYIDFNEDEIIELVEVIIDDHDDRKYHENPEIRLSYYNDNRGDHDSKFDDHHQVRVFYYTVQNRLDKGFHHEPSHFRECVESCILVRMMRHNMLKVDNFLTQKRSYKRKGNK